MIRSHIQWPSVTRIQRNLVISSLLVLAAGGVAWWFFTLYYIPQITADGIRVRELSHIVILYRHAERCDRSENECLGSSTGITLRGNRKAARLGSEMRRLFASDYSLMSSDTLRTQQSAASFAGVMPFVVNKGLDSNECNRQNYSAFIRAATQNPSHRMQIIFTHSECLNFFASHFGHKAMTANYLSNLVLDIDRHHHVKVLGSLALE